MRRVRHCLPPLGPMIFGLAMAVLAPGCTYTGYSIRAPYDTRVKTVYVPVFKSVTFRRDINLMLTEMVIKEIERRTPYKVVNDEAEAGGKHHRGGWFHRHCGRRLEGSRVQVELHSGTLLVNAPG